MMNSLKEELKKDKIDITNISPGRIATGMWDKPQGQSPERLANSIYKITTNA
jgi:short-subunit dehydrogenase